MKYPIINKTWNQDSNSWSSRSLFICPFPWSANYQNFSRPQIRFITLDGPPPYPPRSPSFASLLRGDGASRMHVFVDPRPRYVGNTRVPWGRGEILPLSVLFVSSAMHCLQTSTRFVSLGYCPGEKMKFLPPPLWWDFPIRGTGLDHSGFSRISFFFEIIFPRPLRFLRIFAAFWSLSLYGIRVSLRQGIWCLDYAIYYVMNNCDCNLSRRQIYKIRIMNNVIFEINSILECNLIFVSLEAHLSINHCFITILVLPILI